MRSNSKMAKLWTTEFFPKNSQEFVGNSDIVEKAMEWGKIWNSGQKEPPLLLWGQIGSGKTCLAYLIASAFKWDVVELSSSDIRSKDAIERVVGPALQNASFFGSKRMILIDEVDALTGSDRGGAAAITSIIKDSKNPVVLTATDIFSDKKISGLRFVCKTFEFKKINYLSMAKRLGQILEGLNVEFDIDAVKELAKNSSGDMRSALLDMQTLALGGKIDLVAVKSISTRERQQKVFSVMKEIFKGTDFSTIREARNKIDLDSDMLIRWVEENIPRQYSVPGDVALAFDRISRSDIFNVRIYNKQHWGFLRYSTELAAEGVALSQQKPSHDFVMNQFPGLLSMLSKTSGLRALKKSLGRKIGKPTPSSSRKVISADLPFLKEVFKEKEKAVALSAAFELDEKEIALLLDASPDTKKVKSIFDEAQSVIEERSRPKAVSAPIESNEEGELKDVEAEDSEKENDGKIKQTRLF